MPNIGNIPNQMIDEHVAWHTQPGNPGAGGRAIDPWPFGSTDPAPGSGEEFLVWHRGYIERFRTWVDGLPAAERPDPASIEPWTQIPTMFKMGMVGWNAQRAADEAQLDDMGNFGTLDELGRMLEWGLHGFLHSAASAMFNEPVLLSFASPRSTYFWQLHGLIDHWRQQWVDHPRVRIDPSLIRRLREVLQPRPWPEPWPGPWPGPWPDPPRPIPIPPRPQPDPPPPFELSANELALVRLFRANGLRR